MPPGKRVHLKPGKLYHVYVRRAARRYNKKLRNAKLTIGREREKRFVIAFARRMLAVTMSGRGKVTGKEIREAAAGAAADAGYTTALAKKGNQLVQLPRIQAALDDAFTHAGFSIAEAAAELAGIAKSKKVDVNARLRAIEMRFRLTTGFAVTPQIGKFKVEHEYGDRMFDPSKMHDAPPVDPVEIEGASDADNARAARGDQDAPRAGVVGKKRSRQRRREAAA